MSPADAVWMVWALWSSLAFPTKRQRFWPPQPRRPAMFSVGFAGDSPPELKSSFALLPSGFFFFFACAVILISGIQKPEKVHEKKHASRNGLGRLSTQFYGMERMRFSLCDESFGLLKYQKSKSNPRAPQPVKDHQTCITWSSQV